MVSTTAKSLTGEEKWRLLVVDDDEMLLRSMVRGLVRAGYSVRTSLNGDQALGALKEEPFDVVISDMRMPGMDGAKLLEHVRESWPQTVRMIHSGQSDTESSLRALGVAHQFLAKPWNLDELNGSLRRIFALRASLLDPAVAAAVGKVNVLPSQLKMMQRLQSAVVSDTSSAKDLAAIISEDVALTAKLLQTVNSAFFAPSRRIARVDEAVAYLGFTTVRSLAQSVTIFSAFGASPDLDQVHRHCTAVAHLARAIAPAAVGEDAFTVGLLHDIGLLVLSKAGAVLPDDGGLHALAGAYLLATWGLPWAVVQGVAQHHDLLLDGTDPLQVHDAVAIAHVLLDGAQPDRERLSTSPRLAALGLTSIVKQWALQSKGLGTQATS